MIEKSTDRRIQRTRQLLINALAELLIEKGYEAMTVQDVIDRANVGRSTFYSHFQDKEDLLRSGIETLWAELETHFQSAIPQSETFWSVPLSMFQHAYSHRGLYKALVSDQGGSIALKHLQKQLYRLVFDHLRTVSGVKKTPVPPEILAQHLVSSFISLLIWALDNNTSYSAEQMTHFYRLLVQSTVEMML